jgi:glycosyltransferase involved in cell wall biosynthesis
MDSDFEVDVVVPVRNGGQLLRPAVESVLSQQAVKVRVFVVDDGSTDRAPQRLPDDPRIVVVTSAGRGTADALNTGIGCGSAAYVAIQDADDVSLPGRLAASARHLEDNPGIGLVAMWFQVMVGRRVVATLRPLPAGMLDHNPICHGTMMMRRSVIEAVGGYRSHFRSSEDYDTGLRCAEVAGITILPIVGYRYRVWANQVSVRDPATQVAWAELARRSARARLAGEPDPADLAQAGEAVGSDEAGADEVQAWWAREFAALGSWVDALRCLRRLPPWRAATEAVRLARHHQPQAVWS